MSQVNPAEKFALGTFSIAGCAPFAGLVIDERVIAIGALQSFLASSGAASAAHAASTLDLLEDWDRSYEALSAAAAALRRGEIKGAALVDVSSLKVHVPVNARQIFCSGANYREHVIDYMIDLNVPEVQGFATREEKHAHAAKLMDHRAAHGRPYIFCKLPSALTGPFDPIVLPGNVKQPDWELELAVVIGRPARNVSRADAMDYIAGYTIANDSSARDLLFREDLKAMGTDWVACKNSPSWAPLGPYLVPAGFVKDPHNLHMTLKLNGEVKQDASTNDMIFDIPRQIEYLSAIAQLLPGDVICTGSPPGNGSHYKRYYQPGDVIESTIEGLGMQRNVCKAEATPNVASAVGVATQVLSV